ncbi:MAG: tetratricopeptide repeat protein, partial [Candidatus Methylomirabilales bacterium]
MNKRKALEAAMSYVQMGKLDRAIAEYQAILKADPSDFNVLNSLGDLCARTGNKAEAIAHFMRLGQVYAQDALNLRAIAVYKKVLKLDPSHIEASLACGDMYAEQGLMADAKLQLQRVADHFLQKGDRRKALEVYEKLIRVDPGHHATVQKIAQMLVKARGEEAVSQLVGLGKRLIGAGQGDDARQIHEKVVELLSSQGRAAEAARFTEGFRLVEAEARGGEVATAPSSGEEMAEVGMEETPLEPSADIGEALAAEPGVLESTGDASLLMEGIGGEAQESVTLEEMLEAGVPGSGGVESGDETEPASITLDA